MIMPDRPIKDSPTLEEQVGALVDVLWEIKHELTEIRRNLELPEAYKAEKWRKSNTRRAGI